MSVEQIQSLYGEEILLWGRRGPKGESQGGAIRNSLDRRWFTTYWSYLFDTLERDGPMVFSANVWRSEGGRTVSYMVAVVNDYGDLVPVSQPDKFS